MRTHQLGSLDSLFNRSAELDAQLLSNGLQFPHHFRSKLPRLRKLTDVYKGCLRQSTNGIEQQIAPGLKPDF